MAKQVHVQTKNEDCQRR
ncbi:hypothetical protein C5167_041689 [Papaver somniferum]|nr:hypothetical protein C5167_041689 [Papaver somniferum]